MSGMAPGVYENGGIYNHAVGFKIMADCKEGRADQALRSLLKMIPDDEKTRFLTARPTRTYSPTAGSSMSTSKTKSDSPG